MLIRTHLAITLCLTLFFIPFVRYPILFLLVALLATYIPDIDSKKSRIGNHWYLRPFQWIARHRGFVHSFSFLLLLSLIFVFFIPFLALPFFLGYSSHLIADSFTLRGIRPFFPLRCVSKGNITTGGVNEFNVFVFFILVDVILFVTNFYSFFNM
ncbi:hypothetical protein GF378_01745 [Candidatus Pacearchaeota archaeon]|nr:hypothetical protein [Candidatus Pacearchaeota archaeon]